MPPGEVGGDIFLSSSSNELQDGARLGSYIGSESITSSHVDDGWSACWMRPPELDPDRREAVPRDNEVQLRERRQPILTYLSVNGGAENLAWTPRYDDTARVEDMTLG